MEKPEFKIVRYEMEDIIVTSDYFNENDSDVDSVTTKGS